MPVHKKRIDTNNKIMEIIIPAAGLSTRFPNMRPKYTLTDYTGKMMIEKSIEPFLNNYNITIGILRDHETAYNITRYLNNEFLSSQN
jgi:2-C-methyl-D-erythritol 4-phosphate cytidylyltransferase